MKKNLSLYLLLMIIFSVTDNVLASEGNILSLDKTLIVQLVIFVSAIFMLNEFLFKPLLDLDARREKLTTGTVSEAHELKMKAEETVKEYRGKINAARAQVQDERNKIRKQAQTSASEMIAMTREEINTMLDEARDNIEKESSELREKIRPEIEIIARDVASRLINKEI